MTRPLQTSSEFCKSRLLTLLSKIIKLLFSVCCIQPGVAQPHYDRSQIDARSVLYAGNNGLSIGAVPKQCRCTYSYFVFREKN